MEAASDYRLNYRLFKACKGEVDRLCPGSCKSEEGQVGFYKNLSGRLFGVGLWECASRALEHVCTG
jgi:hypothetical protein